MHIDLPKLMYQAFQSCRLGRPYTNILLSVLAQALAAYHQQSTAVILVPSFPVQQLSDELRQKIKPEQQAFNEQETPFPASAEPFLALAQVATRELQHLWTNQNTTVVKALGYALHTIPRFVRHPEQFNAMFYTHSVQVIGTDWTNVSLDLQASFAHLVGLSTEQLGALMKVQDATT